MVSAIRMRLEGHGDVSCNDDFSCSMYTRHTVLNDYSKLVVDKR